MAIGDWSWNCYDDGHSPHETIEVTGGEVVANLFTDGEPYLYTRTWGGQLWSSYIREYATVLVKRPVC